MKRLLFYVLSVALAFAAVLVGMQMLISDKAFGLGGVAFVLIYIVLPVFAILVVTLFVYEVKHPIENESTYKFINILSMIIILGSLFTIILYLIPIISNLKYFSEIKNINYNYHIPSIDELLMYRFLVWRYVLLFLGLVTLFLSIKKINFARLAFYTALVLPVIMQITGIGFFGKDLATGLDHSYREAQEAVAIYNSNQALAEDDIFKCPEATVLGAHCIKDLAYKQNNVELCLNDMYFPVKAECISHFALVDRDANLCLKLLGENIDIGLFRSCINPVAKSLKDPDVCDLYNELDHEHTDNWVNFCKSQIY